jgi:hypothetical protein
MPHTAFMSEHSFSRHNLTKGPLKCFGAFFVINAKIASGLFKPNQRPLASGVIPGFPMASIVLSRSRVDRAHCVFKLGH